MTRAQILGKAAALLAAIACLGAATDEPLAPAESRSLPFEILSIAIFVAMAVAIVVWVVVITRRRIEERNIREKEAAMLLEAEVTSLIARRQGDATPSAPVAPRESEVGKPQLETGGASVPAVAAEPPAAAAQSVEAILAKLRSGGLLVGVEGAVYLSDGRSEGKIVRLRDGKMAVVLPCLESAEFLARQIKRFDLCIVALGGDQVCVISPLGTYIADQISIR